MRKITVRADFSGVLPTAPYANNRPGFTAEESFEFEGTAAEAVAVIEARQKELQDICYSNFEKEAEKARILKIQQDLKNFRFYEINGEKYPSCTSILNYDSDFFCESDDLKQYASQGNLIDAEVRNFVKTGKFVPSSELQECIADRFIIKTGSLKLSLEPCAFPAFLEKFPIKNLRSIETAIFNKEHRYAGTPDLIGEYEGLETLVSIKRTFDPKKNFIQESAYSKCIGMENIKQMMVVELKPEADGGNKCGYGKPRVSQDIDKYFELFLMKRRGFKKIYGV